MRLFLLRFQIAILTGIVQDYTVRPDAGVDVWREVVVGRGNKMTIKIVTDSGADIPIELVNSLRITVVPLNLSFGEQTYLDGVDLAPDEFYQKLLNEGIMPTTSQPSVGSFIEVYKELKESSNQILSIHLSAKLSGTLNSATQAANEEQLDDAIKIIDSKQASIALGFSVIAAAEAVAGGASLEEAASIAESTSNRTDTFILFDTLEYLVKGGRIGRANALLGSILQIKPILTLVCIFWFICCTRVWVYWSPEILSRTF